MKSGIYKILNTLTGDFYIGSSNRLNRRKAEHWLKLRKERHDNQILQRAFLKYGEDCFTFEVVELCEESVMLEVEQRYLDLLKPKYNIAKLAGGRFRAGVPLNDKQKATLDFYRRRPVAESTKEKLRKANLGKAGTEEKRAKVSKASKENWANPEYVRNISEKRKLKCAEPEYHEAMKTRTAKTWEDPTVREKRLEAMRKSANEPELKARRAESTRRYWAEQRELKRIKNEKREENQGGLFTFGGS